MTVDKWDQRQLCSDGACVGLIGPDGTCKVCGRAAPNWGDERNRGLIPPEASDDAAEAGDPDAVAAADDAEDAAEAEADDDEYEDDDDAADDSEGAEPAAGDVAAAVPVAAAPVWDERELCSDGACIGVIGDDGKCKVCGKPGTQPAVARVIAAADVITTDDAVGDASQVATSDAITTDPAPQAAASDEDAAESRPGDDPDSPEIKK